jgi:hypothetical protein
METSFFKQVCSAELCQYRIVDRMTGEEMDVRLAELVDPAGRLSRLGQDLGSGQPIANASSCPPLIRDSGSLPLLAGLRAVALSGGIAHHS